MREVKLNLIPFNPFRVGLRTAEQPARARVPDLPLNRGFATMLRTTRGTTSTRLRPARRNFDDRTKRRERYIARLKDHGAITHVHPRAEARNDGLVAVPTPVVIERLPALIAASALALLLGGAPAAIAIRSPS